MEIKTQASVVTFSDQAPQFLRREKKDEQFAQRTLLAFEGDAFIRRQHIKPFDSKRKLKNILPSLLEDSLLKTDADSQLHHVLTTASLEDHKFTSYSLKAELLTQGIESAEQFDSPITCVAPLPVGLTHYAPSDKACILLAPHGKQIQAVAVNSDGLMVDFRTFSTVKWKEQGNLTLQTWLNQMGTETSLFATASVSTAPLSAALKKKVEKLSLDETIPENDAAAYGLLSMFENHWHPELSFACEDTTTKRSMNRIFKKLNKTLPVFALACLLSVAHWGYNNHLFNKENTRIENKVNKAFEEALPGTPLVDAPLQMTRRVNELALLSGVGVVNTSPIGGQLVALQKHTSQAGISMVLDDLNITSFNVKIRGQVAALSHVDGLQSVMKNVFEGYSVELKSAQIGEAGKVNFHVEAVKK